MIRCGPDAGRAQAAGRTPPCNSSSGAGCRYGGVKTISGASLGLGLQGELLTELDVAAVGFDLDGTILSWNRAAGRLYGRMAHEMLGTSIDAIRVSPDDAVVAASIIGELVRAGRWQGQLVIEDASGLWLQLDVRAATLVDGDRHPAGFEAVFLDVSGRVQAEQRSAERETRQRLVHRVAGLVSWEWNPRDDHLRHL